MEVFWTAIVNRGKCNEQRKSSTADIMLFLRLGGIAYVTWIGKGA
jgi:hypothetical protein